MSLRRSIVQSAAAVLNTATTNVTNAAFVDLLTAANNKYPATHIMISNNGAQPISLFVGASGSEVDTGIIIHPGLSPCIVPFAHKSGVRLSVKSLGATQSSGFVCCSFFDIDVA